MESALECTYTTLRKGVEWTSIFPLFLPSQSITIKHICKISYRKIQEHVLTWRELQGVSVLVLAGGGFTQAGKIEKGLITKSQYEKGFRSRRHLAKRMYTDQHLETNRVLQEDVSCKIKAKRIINADYK